MRWPSSGGLNQRERTKSESLRRASGIDDRLQHAHPAQSPDHRRHEPLAPIARAGLALEQLGHVCVSEPEIAQRTHREIVRERARQHRAVDAARRCARDDVDDDAELDLAADFPQKLKIDLLGIELGVLRIDMVGEGCVEARRSIRDRMQRDRGPDELQDLLADAVHIDRERHPAEEDQRKTKLFLPQARTPRSG
jgi:hypothetical protein